MLLEPGDQLLIVHRRLFDKDRSRYFVGRVEAYEHGLARVSGYTWVQDAFDGHFMKKADSRTKIVALASGTLLVYALPRDVELQSLRFEPEANGRLMLRSGARWEMDLSEFCHSSAPSHQTTKRG